MKYILLVCFIFCTVENVHMMSEKQMKSAANLIRNVCQPKTKVTNAQIDNMHKGDFEEDEKPKCYMKCVFETLKLMKNGKMDYDSTMKQVGTLPASYIEISKATVEKCKNSAQNSNACEAAYELAKCWYFANPEYYFFP